MNRIKRHKLKWWIGCAGVGLAVSWPCHGGALRTPDSDPGNGSVEVSVPLRSRSSEDALLFANGDLLFGELVHVTVKEGIQWRHADAVEPIHFESDAINQIHFHPREQPETDVSGRCRVQLNNRDELAGRLRECDAKSVVLDTWYGGTLTLPRDQVRFIEPIPDTPPVIYSGPDGLEGWTLGDVDVAMKEAGYWQYKEGAFYANHASSIARDLKLPEKARIQFDLAWKGTLHLAVALYTGYLQPVKLAAREEEPDFGGFYSLQLNNFSANLLPVEKDGPLRFMGQVSVRTFHQKDSAHLDIRVDKSARSIALIVDGELLKVWTDPDGFVGDGSGMRFVHQGQGVSRLSGLKITEWDGQFRLNSNRRQRYQNDLLRLRNGDRMLGTVDWIRKDELQFTHSQSTVHFPLDEVQEIQLAGRFPEKNEPDSGTVQAEFTDGGRITFQLGEWTQEKISGTSPYLGEIQFKPEAFSRLIFQ